MLTTILVLASVVAAVVPMVSFLGLAWWFDRYDREPIWLIVLTFFWGALIATTFALIFNTGASLGLGWIFGPEAAGTFTPVIVAPLVEEPSKAAVLFLLLLSRHFDNTTDGFVYGAAAGLGFGMTENFMYFSSAASTVSADAMSGLMAWMMTVAARTLFSAVMHATATACVGASMGLVRFRSGLLKIIVIPAGFAMAMGIHALWNGLLTFQPPGVSGALLDFALFPFEFIAVFLLFQISMGFERRSLRRELTAEAREEGTLPLAHVPALTSYIQRAWTHFTPPHVDQDAYVRAATTLALRRQQVRRLRGRKRVVYDREIERLRREVNGILSAA